jgi:hypothetical protein
LDSGVATVGAYADLRDRAGRHVPVTLYGGSSKPERLAGYADAGIDRVVLRVQQGDAAAIERRMDHLADCAAEAGLLAPEARSGA